MSSKIDRIVADKLCLGCGLCEAVCGSKSVSMELQQSGFFRPVVKEVLPEKEAIIEKICPGKNVDIDLPFGPEESIWGKTESVLSAYSTDPEIRFKGSSGGIVSAIAISLLENGTVGGVLQVGGDSLDFERNTLTVSRTRNDVLRCASSRYAPALIFDKIIEILESGSDTFAFIGKPCDISALKNFLGIYPQYKDRFKLTVSIMCAGMPSFNGTREIIKELNAQLPVKDLVYRGNGWPGFFSFQDKSGREYRKTYNDSWGKNLNKHLNFRCKICPDGIGLQADIAVGDAWETIDGYPDFEEKEGQSLVLTRSPYGVSVMNEMQKANEISSFALHHDKLRIMQPYQFDRRQRVGIRVLAYQLIKGKKLQYKGVYLWHNLTKVQLSTLVKEFLGTVRRTLR